MTPPIPARSASLAGRLMEQENGKPEYQLG